MRSREKFDVGITMSLEPGDLGNLRNVITAVVLGEIWSKLTECWNVYK